MLLLILLILQASVLMEGNKTQAYNVLQDKYEQNCKEIKHDCNCREVKDEKTYWGKTKGKFYLISLKVKNEVRGKLICRQEPIADALVELYDHPEVSKGDRFNGIGQNRVYVCKTDENGYFCINNLSAGTYELRCSKKGYEVVARIVDINPKKYFNEEHNFLFMDPTY